MPATEKDLAEDAPWKKIQQNTFTRWINEHLKCVNKRIVDLQLDLGDGLRLIALLEVLSHKKMYRKYHPRPNFGQMKLENVSVALEFLDKENIKLVSIGEWPRSIHPCAPSVASRTKHQPIVGEISAETSVETIGTKLFLGLFPTPGFSSNQYADFYIHYSVLLNNLFSFHKLAAVDFNILNHSRFPLLLLVSTCDKIFLELLCQKRPLLIS